MKIDSLIVQYLYKNRKISIQQIGRFEMDSSIPDPIPEQMKTLPDNSIHFIYDEKATADERFIIFIMEQTKKIRPLATSDLESFSTLNRQFLNIGKPLVIQNLGTIIKTQNNEFAFTQGQSVPPKPEIPKSLPGSKEQLSEPVDFSETNQTKRKTSWVLPLLLLFVVAGILIVLFFKINILEIFKGKEPATEVTAAEAPSDSTLSSTAAIENQSDSCHFNIPLTTPTDSATALKNLFTKKAKTDSTVMVIKTEDAKFVVVYPASTLRRDSAQVADSIKHLVDSL